MPFGPMPCSAASSRRECWATWSNVVTPMVSSALVAGLDIFGSGVADMSVSLTDVLATSMARADGRQTSGGQASNLGFGSSSSAAANTAATSWA